VVSSDGQKLAKKLPTKGSTDVLDRDTFAFSHTRDVVLKKKRGGGRLKQDLDKDLQLHGILILLY